MPDDRMEVESRRKDQSRKAEANLLAIQLLARLRRWLDRLERKSQEPGLQEAKRLRRLKRTLGDLALGSPQESARVQEVVEGELGGTLTFQLQVVVLLHLPLLLLLLP